MNHLRLYNKVGKMGEDIAVKWLLSHKFSILDRNWRQNTGEIDIISEKEGKIYFFEVKAILVKDFELASNTYNPLEKITKVKLNRLHKTTELYCIKKSISHETKLQIDALAIYLNQNTKQAKILRIENII